MCDQYGECEVAEYIPDVRGFIVKCEKCGAEIQTPNMTIDNARGYWNMKMSVLERTEKKAAAK